MDSDEFFRKTLYTDKGEPFNIEYLYLKFAERFRRENVVQSQQNLMSTDDLVGFIDFNPDYYADDFEDTNT